jgi:hypothetical protein
MYIGIYTYNIKLKESLQHSPHLPQQNFINDLIGKDHP